MLVRTDKGWALRCSHRDHVTIGGLTFGLVPDHPIFDRPLDVRCEALFVPRVDCPVQEMRRRARRAGWATSYHKHLSYAVDLCREHSPMEMRTWLFP